MKTQLSKPARSKARYTELKTYYHRIKLHSSLAYQRPISFEFQLKQIDQRN